MPAAVASYNRDRASASVSPQQASVTPITASMPSKSKKKARPHPIHTRLASRPGVVIVVPPKQLIQAPASRDVPADAPPSAAHIFLCPDFDAARGAESCPRGAQCPCVHADVRGAAEYTAHELPAEGEAAWRRAADVPFPLLSTHKAATAEVMVAPPNGKEASERVAAQHCLLTRALESERRPLSHCAHFARKGVCDLGAECQFVHHVPTLAAADGANQPRKPSLFVQGSDDQPLPSFAAEVPATADHADSSVFADSADVSTPEHAGQRAAPVNRSNGTPMLAHGMQHSSSTPYSSPLAAPGAKGTPNRRANTCATQWRYRRDPYNHSGIVFSLSPSTSVANSIADA